MKRLLLALVVAAMLVAPALADIPILRDVNASVTGSVSLKKLTLTGQSSCAMVLSGSGSATITPMGSSDGGTVYQTVASIGAQTANGTYGGNISPYLTNFYVAVSGVTGTVTVAEACSATILVPATGPSGPPGPGFSPGPFPVPTPFPTANAGSIIFQAGVFGDNTDVTKTQLGVGFDAGATEPSMYADAANNLVLGAWVSVVLFNGTNVGVLDSAGDGIGMQSGPESVTLADGAGDQIVGSAHDWELTIGSYSCHIGGASVNTCSEGGQHQCTISVTTCTFTVTVPAATTHCTATALLSSTATSAGILSESGTTTTVQVTGTAGTAKANYTCGAGL